MNDQKTRIASFIETLEGEQMVESTVILGGAAGTSDDLMSTTNNGACKNASYDGCNKATNKGSCKNAVGSCNNSKNGGDCDNSWVLDKELHPVVTTSCVQNGSC